MTLDFPGRRGEASRRKSVAPDHTLAAILSQGEQKVIAIADFLAEASLRAASAPPGRTAVEQDAPVARSTQDAGLWALPRVEA